MPTNAAVAAAPTRAKLLTILEVALRIVAAELPTVEFILFTAESTAANPTNAPLTSEDIITTSSSITVMVITSM